MDAGGENVLVSHYMTEMRGISCNSAICDMYVFSTHTVCSIRYVKMDRL